MRYPIYLRATLTVTLLVYLGCVDQGGPVTPPIVKPARLVCVPDSGTIGDMVKIVDGTFAFRASDNIVKFTNAIEVRADSGTTSHVFTTIPFGALNGPVRVETPTGVFFSGEFKVTEIYDPGTLNVVRYSLSPAISADDSIVIDPMGFHNIWQATLRHDTVAIHRENHGGEVYNVYNFVFLNKGAGELPRLLNVWVYHRDDTNISGIDTLTVGIMKIQNWDPNTGLSGKFFPRLSEWAPITFWVSPSNINP
jgi:hypothetical protein